MGRALGTALLGVAICLAGGLFDLASLYVPGAALVLIAFAAPGWVVLAVRGARLTRAPGPATVIEEEPYPLRLELRTGRLPPPAGELIEPLLGWPVPIGGRWSRRIRLNLRFTRRGRRVLEPGLVIVRDPLGLYERRLLGQGGEQLLVLPRVEPVEPVNGGGLSRSGLRGSPEGIHGLAGGRLEGAPAELEIDGLRPYRQGAPAARIHWPTVARRGEMLERRLVAGLESAPLVVLDASRPESEQALDAAVRAAASLCRELAAIAGCGLLLPGDRRPLEVGRDLGAWPHAHARLAVVESGMAPRPVSRAGAVFWVTAATARPAGLDRVACSARYLVTPSPPPGARPSFKVAGCIGMPLERAAPTRRVA